MLQGLLELPKELLHQVCTYLSPDQITSLEQATKIDMDIARMKRMRTQWVQDACFRFRQRYRSLLKQMQTDKTIGIRNGDIYIHPDHHKTLYDLLMETNDIYRTAKQLHVDFVGDFPPPTRTPVSPEATPTVWYDQCLWLYPVWIPKKYYADDSRHGIACSCDVVNLNGEDSNLIMTLYPVMDEGPDRAKNGIYKGPSSRLTEVSLKGTQGDIQELMSNWGLHFVNHLPFTLTSDL